MSKAPAVPQTSMEAAGAVTTPTSLTLTNPDLPWEVYEQLGAFIGEVNRACAWWVGDLVNALEQLFGEKVANIDDVLGLSPQTISNRASVARWIPPNKRRAGLAFGTHAEVAYMEPKERDRWLDRAEAGGWTRAILRLNMRLDKGEIEGVADRGVTGKTGSDELGGTPQNGAPAEVLGEPVLPHSHVCPACGVIFTEEEE